MKHTQIFCLLAVAAATAAPSFAGDLVFTAPAYREFNNQQWGTLTLNQTTAKDVKGHYHTEGKNDIPWSIQLTTPAGSGYKVNTLFSGKNDGSDPLHAILVRYDRGLPLADLDQSVGSEGTLAYQSRRNSDWAIDVYPDQGIVAFVNGAGTHAMASAVLLLPKDALITTTRDLEKDVTDIVPIVDPYADQPKILTIGDVEVDTELSGFDMSDMERSNLEDDLRDATARGALRYETAAPGRYTARVSGQYKADKGGRIDVTATIDGRTPYGPIRTAGEATLDVKAGGIPVDSAVYSILLRRARHSAERNLLDAIRQQGPPTPQAVQAQAWQQLLVRFRLAASNALGRAGDVPIGGAL